MKVICELTESCDSTTCDHRVEHEYHEIHDCVSYCHKKQKDVTCIPINNQKFKATGNISLYSLAKSDIDGGIIKEIIADNLQCNINYGQVISSDSTIYKFILSLLKIGFVEEYNDDFKCKVGDEFIRKDSYEYKIVRSDIEEYLLINLKDGNRWSEKVYKPAKELMFSDFVKLHTINEFKRK